MSSNQPIRNKIRSYIFQQYPALESKGLADDDLLAGVLDSLAVLGLVGFIEPEFSVELTASDLTDENFETVAAVVRLVERLGASVR
jgi:acyl carrier protein